MTPISLRQSCGQMNERRVGREGTGQRLGEQLERRDLGISGSLETEGNSKVTSLVSFCPAPIKSSPTGLGFQELVSTRPVTQGWWREQRVPSQRGVSRERTAHYPATLGQVAQSLSSTEAQEIHSTHHLVTFQKGPCHPLSSRSKEGMAVATAPKQAWPPWPPSFSCSSCRQWKQCNRPVVCDCTPPNPRQCFAPTDD